MTGPSQPFISAQEYLTRAGLDGWLLYDYHGANPIFWNLLGTAVRNVTRPVWLHLPSTGEPAILAHDVDRGRFPAGGPRVEPFTGRLSMMDALRRRLRGAKRIAMEYSPDGELPRVGRVDAGTIELVRSLGVEVVSSGDVLQYATERWTPGQLETHRFAAGALTEIVHEAFEFVGENVRWKLTEHDVAEFIRGRYDRLGLEASDGPVVAFGRHSSDPHYEPAAADSAVIRRQGWLLIDLWARRSGEPDSVYADITWTASLGGEPTSGQRRAFDVVRGARDSAFEFLRREVNEGRRPQGWEVDHVARRVIEDAGHGGQFVHRLGHSLGREVHSNGVNLDGWETRDTRRVIDGLAVTIEPGIYLPEFGVRSEIDVFMGPNGPEITSALQSEVVVIQP